MKKEGYYSTGEFMKQANITKKTIRYYDEKNILKPSFVSDSGARYYTEKDLAKLQQILLLKYLGFSLGDIKEMQVDDADKHFIVNSLNIQQKLVEDRIEQLQLVASTIREATDDLQADREVDWSKLFELIQVADLESILKKQYKDASNIMARINLHKQYSVNKQGWFPWIYEQMQVKPEQKILELGCGAGDIWVKMQRSFQRIFQLQLRTFPMVCCVMQDAKSAGRMQCFRMRSAVVRRFRLQTKPLIWSWRTMCSFTAMTSGRRAGRSNAC